MNIHREDTLLERFFFDIRTCLTGTNGLDFIFIPFDLTNNDGYLISLVNIVIILCSLYNGLLIFFAHNAHCKRIFTCFFAFLLINIADSSREKAHRHSLGIYESIYVHLYFTKSWLLFRIILTLTLTLPYIYFVVKYFEIKIRLLTIINFVYFVLLYLGTQDRNLTPTNSPTSNESRMLFTIFIDYIFSNFY